MERCPWCMCNEKMIRYHDEEWGVPVHDDQKQFEFLMMEVMQCGLNWNMMIQKREIFRNCFDNFDYDKVAAYGEKDIQRILETEGMIRSRRKIEAVIQKCPVLSGYPQGVRLFQRVYLELYEREDVSVYRTSERRDPGKKRAFGQGKQRSEKTRTEVYGICYSVFTFAGMRYY